MLPPSRTLASVGGNEGGNAPERAPRPVCGSS